MKLAIITHVEHIPKGETYFGYSAYVREMNIWGTYASELIIVAPVVHAEVTKIHLKYAHQNIRLLKVPAVFYCCPSCFSKFGRPCAWRTIFTCAAQET